jgi:hypothetical protein
MIRPPFPAVLDSSLMATFKSCPRKAELEYMLHWKPGEQSVHLHAGKAYASGIEAARVAYYVDGETPEDSLAVGLRVLLTEYGDFACPPESAKSAERTAGALEYYFSQYRLGEDSAIPMTLPGGKRGIEFNFLEPIDLIHPETGDPILYSGRMDMMCNYEGMALGEDDKTTSQLGASWPRQWDLRSQFTGYVWGAGRAGIKLDGFLVRGVSILKTKYDTLQAITYRPAWLVERWYEQLLKDGQRLIDSWKSGYFDYNLDHACAEYGGCPFTSVCQMRDPAPLLRQRFQRRVWNPVLRTETLIEDEE